MSPIGVFDSGYGGLTVLKEMEKALPQYDYLYLGDNARAPYGTRSFDTVYRYTLECVRWLLQQGCPLVILACNTASAKALRTIQQHDLEKMSPEGRVLGVLRPTTETVGHYSKTGRLGILATNGTVHSQSYPIEISKYFPAAKVYQQACPMWVPLIENNEHESEGASYFIQKYVDALMEQDKEIDTVLLACTHYPLLEKKIQEALPEDIRLISQGSIVASSLQNYLERHPEIERRISKAGSRTFYTTDDAQAFQEKAAIFYGRDVQVRHMSL